MYATKWRKLKYLSPVSSMIKFWMTTFWFIKVVWLWCCMFHRNQKVVIQNFIIELTGDKYFNVTMHFFCFPAQTILAIRTEKPKGCLIFLSSCHLRQMGEKIQIFHDFLHGNMNLTQTRFLIRYAFTRMCILNKSKLYQLVRNGCQTIISALETWAHI